MNIKPLLETEELQIWRSLHTRMKLTDQEKKIYSYLLKGFEGELAFEKLLESSLYPGRLILSDLLFEKNKLKI